MIQAKFDILLFYLHNLENNFIMAIAYLHNNIISL